ncbi:hypothetical protein [Microbacterium oxydans]|nr:hypothetical protein [Microbacterium oxydans]
MSDYATAHELRAQAARGVKIQTAEEYFEGEPGPHGARFLRLSFPTECDVALWYDDTRGMWRLEVDTLESRPVDATAQVAQAASIAEAARICRDFNTRIVRRDRRDGNAALTNEIAAMLADRAVSPFTLALAMNLTPGVVAAKLAGRSGWTAGDLLRIANVIDADNPGELFQRLARIAA